MSETQQIEAQPMGDRAVKPQGAGPVALLSLGLCIVLGAVAAYQAKQISELKSAQVGMTKVHVVDDVDMVRLAIEQGADRFNPQQVLSKIGAIVIEGGLGDSLILSKSVVLYAPKGVEVPVAAPPSAPVSVLGASGGQP